MRNLTPTNFTPVTKETLQGPSADDWLMFSRTYDAQRFTPLNQITRQNVSQLRMAWSRGIDAGIQEHIPLVHDGVLFVGIPGGLEALDATNGDLIWEYKRPANGRAGRTMAIFEDMIIYAAPDSALVAVDARTGKLRWESKVGTSSSGPRVVGDKVIAGIQAAAGGRASIVALDAHTGREAWKFYTAPGTGEPGGDTWADMPVDKRVANPWGLPGSYDPVRNRIYWGIANPIPFTRMKRHNGDPDAISRSSPAELYSNSTVAIDPDTGKLDWYFQYLPGDDWDQDHTHERILLRTPLSIDPKEVKWINPRIKRGEERDVVVTVAEAGGIWTIDRATGQFLWATPFPYDTPEFHISKIDVETGKTFINWDLVFKKDGDRHIICAHNTKGYWPMAYHPGRNSIYVQYNDQCLDMTANNNAASGFGPRKGILRPSGDVAKYGGLAKVNMATGKIEWRYTQHAPTNGAVLATAGDVIFWGDMNRRFRAFDAESGKVLWEAILPGVVQMSTISYAVNGKQYIAVMTGDGTAGTTIPFEITPDIRPPRNHNSINVFALP
ncbi:MAG: hypothetical protein EXQ56_10080 [Acidobacteria bacterium]|nr:hypothetical protein [Acidobacteriota bacterium]